MADRDRPPAYMATTIDGHVIRHRNGMRFPTNAAPAGVVTLACWECGHVEIDDGSTHECDGRDVCMATYHRVALPSHMLAEFHEHPNALVEGTNTQRLRRTLHDEEHAELMHELEEAAAGRADLAQIARELADVVYITYGSAWAFGIDLDAAVAEVHRAAMDKMAAGLRREDGKILKPPGFRPPDMTAAIRGAYQEAGDA